MNVLRNGKVRRTAAEWGQVLERFAGSGLTAREFCNRESINLASFVRWRKKLDTDTGSDEQPESERFVEVASSDGVAAFWSVEFELPDGRMLRVRG